MFGYPLTYVDGYCAFWAKIRIDLGFL